MRTASCRSVVQVGSILAAGTLFAALALNTVAPSSAGAQARLAHDLATPSGDAQAPVNADTIEVPPPPGAAPASEPSSVTSADALTPDRARYPLPSSAAGDEQAAPSVRIPSRVTTRLRSLDAGLRSLASAGGGNVVNAVLSMITGGLSITLGAVKDPNDDWLSAYLYVYGGTAAARGALELLLAPDPSAQAIRYQHMPMNNRDQVRSRLRFGEQTLEAIAEQAMIARVLDASLNLAAGVAVVPIYLAPNDFAVGNPLDYFVLVGAGVSIISAVITLASSSAAEQRWGAYQELRERLTDEAQGERDEAAETEAELGLVPSAPRATVRVSPFGLTASF